MWTIAERVRNLLIQLVRGFIRLYQLAVSPWFAGVCRYQPTCSTYARQALARHGLIKGLALTAWRILRCHPWSKGGYDPVRSGPTANKPQKPSE